MRATLDDFGLVGWPKTSGSRGMHIYVRIEPRWTFDEVRRAALALAREVERRAPALATSKWWKEERHGVFLDYNQNAKDRTVAAAYSVRPRRRRARLGAARRGTKSTTCDPADFTLATMPARFAQRRRSPRRHRRARVLARRAARALGAAASAKGWATRRGRRTTQAGRRGAARRAVTPARSRRIRWSRSDARADKADALAGLERWKARHPDAAAHLQPADVLVDAMRGRFQTWTRIRVNLQHVPAELRPPQEPLDPDEDMADDWKASAAASRRAEDLLELVRSRDLELIVAAVAAACRDASAGTSPRGGTDRPACGRTSPRTRARCAAAPRTDPCPRSSGSARRASASISAPPASAHSRHG